MLVITLFAIGVVLTTASGVIDVRAHPDARVALWGTSQLGQSRWPTRARVVYFLGLFALMVAGSRWAHEDPLAQMLLKEGVAVAAVVLPPTLICWWHNRLLADLTGQRL